MQDYVGLPIAFEKPTLSCPYIAHFAIRNNNNLFYRFPKIDAGGGPETKHFIGVALCVS